MALKKVMGKHPYKARYADDDTYCDMPGCSGTRDSEVHNMGPDYILIERREEVARIPLHEGGTEHPVRAAFNNIADYMADHDDLQGYELAFEWNHRTFRATLDPQ